MTVDRRGAMQQGVRSGPEESDDTVAAEQSPNAVQVRSAALVILAVLAVAYTLALARPLLLPIAFAWLAKVALSPLIRGARKLRIPKPIAAVVLLLTTVGLSAYGIAAIVEPAREWAARLPAEIERVQSELRLASQHLKSVDDATKAVERLATGDDDEVGPIEVEVVGPSTRGVVLAGLRDFGSSLAIMLVLLYFLLATDDVFLSKVVSVLPRLRDKKAAVETVRAIESSTAVYLRTVVMTNACLGIVVGSICWLGDLPNPALWGTMAGVANFIPYIGAIFGVLIVAIVGLTAHPELGAALAPALAYGVVNVLEGMLITPLVLGRRLTMSPVILFLWLFFMSWIWGIPGALLAVPLLAAIKIACDNIPRLGVIGRLLDE